MTSDWDARLAGARLPRPFRRRVVTIEPGGSRPHRAAEWRDALVLVVRGTLLLETRDGHMHGFGRGDVLWLDGIGARSLRNPGRVPTVLVAISRRGTDPFRADAASYR
ncbi:MAG TPA: cupin domain-containing protein [Actinomycetota bacterium]|nr:cupin domain-containing protein [Actinomycetota bacterium]